MNNTKWLSWLEYFALVGSGVGSVAAIASQQFAFTAAPVSCLLLLNVINRSRLDQETLETAKTSIAQLDQRFSNDIKELNLQIRTRPNYADLANLRKTIQQRHDNSIAQLQRDVSQRLSEIEQRKSNQLEQELAQFNTKYSQLSEALATVLQYLDRVATTNRVETAESAIAQLRHEVVQLQTKISEVVASQKQGIPRVLQDELYQIHRRLNNLPQPFDGIALKQEVDGLVKVVGELVTRRDLAKLMAEIEKIRNQHQSLEQTVAPLRSVNTIMRKQIDTLSSWVVNGHPAASTSQIEKLQATVAQLEERLNTGANLAELQNEIQTMLNEHFNQLQAQFNNVQDQAQQIDRHQKHLVDRMGQLPTMLDASALQTQIKYLTSRLEVTESQLATLAQSSTKSNYELIFNLTPSIDPFEQMRIVLKEAIAQARSRLIVVFPYPDRAMLDDELLQQFQAFLDRGGVLDLGWGHLGDEASAQQARYIYDRTSNPFLKSILSQLTQLKRSYPTQFRFKVLGTRENFLVCDSTYSILGLQPVATASSAFPEMAIGLRTQNAVVIQGLIDRFDHPKLETDSSIAYLNRAMTLYELGDRRGAIKDYSTVIALDPHHRIACNNRALIQFELGDYVSAIEGFTALLAIENQNPIAYFHRGLVRTALNDQTGAMRDLKKAAWLFSMQSDPLKHQHAIAAIEKLRKRAVCQEPQMQRVREA
ncbi:tetratricopeptide repeat protein [Leptolyngbya sp. FACHB-17]|uniref:tetratricopeptide repeat protein n=1 Tax=unclassified Leptolyngbya TaxID=2650499 RepID=UPI001680AD25|nr:tetratricopeptide repeat protein [Leptolyngbya sp. FACHB-17]MBD2082722.1 tetratricopeptide repeat protein [Leptolyngbya sp. FACHB-17]